MEWTAPSHWRRIELLSDIHLDAKEPATFDLWKSYLDSTQADAVCILGDLFSLWVGDDVLGQSNSFERQCVEALRAAGSRLHLFIMVGNRDFLMGESLMRACHAQALPDPSVLLFGEQRFVLSHGDALCSADTSYQSYRSVVRSRQWQTEFLEKTLAERQAIGQQMRLQSESNKARGGVYADVDLQDAVNLLTAHRSNTLIHGHTHRPGIVTLAMGQQRLVLSDWEVHPHHVRADVLRLETSDHSTVKITRQSGVQVAQTPG